MARWLRRIFGEQVGATMAEYALIVAGVALIGAAAIAVFGHKVTDLLGMSAAVVPGVRPGPTR